MAFWDFLGFQNALFAHTMAIWEPLWGLQRSGNGSVMLPCKHGPLCGVWNQFWYKTSRGAESALYCSRRPSLTPLDPPKHPQTPSKPHQSSPNPIIPNKGSLKYFENWSNTSHICVDQDKKSKRTSFEKSGWMWSGESVP